ncbi:unnamed protein product [Urochloa humidicola]
MDDGVYIQKDRNHTSLQTGETKKQRYMVPLRSKGTGLVSGRQTAGPSTPAPMYSSPSTALMRFPRTVRPSRVDVLVTYRHPSSIWRARGASMRRSPVFHGDGFPFIYGPIQVQASRYPPSPSVPLNSDP